MLHSNVGKIPSYIFKYSTIWPRYRIIIFPKTIGWWHTVAQTIASGDGKFRLSNEMESSVGRRVKDSRSLLFFLSSELFVTNYLMKLLKKIRLAFHGPSCRHVHEVLTWWFIRLLLWWNYRRFNVIENRNPKRPQGTHPWKWRYGRWNYTQWEFANSNFQKLFHGNFFNFVTFSVNWRIMLLTWSCFIQVLQ